MLTQAFKRMRVRTGCLRGLDMLWLEITGKCNLTCDHCYAGSSPHLPLTEQMGFEDWCRAMNEARSLGCRHLQFIGGEPTIHPDLWRLIKHARRAGFRTCEVYTNATVLRNELLDQFEEYGILVALSFYCSRPEVHDEITGSRGSFDRTVEGIRRLVDRGIDLRTSVVLMDKNARYERETTAFLQNLGVRRVRSYWVRGIGRGESLKRREAIREGEAVEQAGNGGRGVRGGLGESCSDGGRADGYGERQDRSPMDELCGQCWRGALCIDPSGDAFPCVFSRFAPVGNFLTDGMKGIVRSDELRDFRREVYLYQPGGNGDHA